MTEPVIVVGSAGHAKVVIDVIESQGLYEIAGLVDRLRAVGSLTSGYEVLGGEEDVPIIAERLGVHHAIVAIGDNYVRGKMVGTLERTCPHLAFVSAVHPAACVSSRAHIAPGSVIMPGAVLNSNCRVGRFCIINTNASLDHDSVMEDYSSLAPGATIGGNVYIGSFSALGIGCAVAFPARIGEHTVIGAGSIVVREVGAYAVAYGSPAKVVRSRQPGDRYL